MSLYVGEVKDGLRHGEGEYSYYNGIFNYKGQWNEGYKHGKGSFMLKDYSIYEGEFKNGEMTGCGIKSWVDGSKYEGEFLEGDMHGKGKYFDKVGDLYEGDFVDNKRHGLGNLKFNNGDHYEGEFQNNKISGHGIMKYLNGDIYEGDYIDGLFNGYGKLTYSNGDYYDGNWTNNKKNGNGTLNLPSIGYFYEGNWEEDFPLERSKSFHTNIPIWLSITLYSHFPIITVGQTLDECLLMPDESAETSQEMTINELHINQTEKGRNIQINILKKEGNSFTDVEIVVLDAIDDIPPPDKKAKPKKGEIIEFHELPTVPSITLPLENGQATLPKFRLPHLSTGGDYIIRISDTLEDEKYKIPPLDITVEYNDAKEIAKFKKEREAKRKAEAKEREKEKKKK